MMPQLPPDEEPAEEPTVYHPRDIVALVNVNSGLNVVGCNYQGGRLHTPNPTGGEIFDGPHETAAGPTYRVRLLDGVHRGKVVTVFHRVIRLVERTRVASSPRPRRRRWAWRPLGRV